MFSIGKRSYLFDLINRSKDSAMEPPKPDIFRVADKLSFRKSFSNKFGRRSDESKEMLKDLLVDYLRNVDEEEFQSFLKQIDASDSELGLNEK